MGPLRLKDRDEDRLRRLAQARDVEPDQLLREAVSQYLEREEARQGFLAEAQSALEDYRQTGTHLEFADLESWFESWGESRETKLPPWRS
ncbi:CopG family ribbon-helix-helix protein [Lutibaculum baratangense]|uniref:Prevent host death protein, Phd antitoxin n=1 Tax=Lutibaculum baratangense AMV1 TaxID=631454 RepID=V4TLM2_9HYPH|nr:hypothetical protein [Lutibaculum baratangense]ESR26703.1 hypothetical protein N177_0487 [Lutibaculum baratangense AMV1]